MGDYMTDLDTVNIEKVAVLEIEAEDLLSLLYKWLDEVLFLFCAEPFIVTKVILCKFRIRKPSFEVHFLLECDNDRV